MARKIECIFKVKIQPNELGVLFNGLSYEPAFLLDDPFDRVGASKSMLRELKHCKFLRESSRPAGDDDIDELIKRIVGYHWSIIRQ